MKAIISSLIKFLKERKEEIITCSIFLIFAFGFNIYRVEGDGSTYYRFLEGLLRIPDPESGYLKGFIQSGSAFFNAPFYILTYLIEHALRLKFNINGITLRTISINIASNFYMLCSILLSVKILKMLKLKKIIIPVLAVLFSTSAFAVSVVMASYNHAVDIFLATLFIYVFLALETNGQKPAKAVYLGLIYVIALLVRYFNFVYIIPLVMYYLVVKDYKKLKFFIIGVASIGWIIPLIFYLYNGGPLNCLDAPSEGMALLAGMTPWFPKYSLKCLVHPLHGLFVWSPVLILSMLGLFVFPKNKQKVGYLFLSIWALFVIVYGFSPVWYAGWSFSNRYFSSLFPIYVIGLSVLLEKYGKKVLFLIIICTFYSVFLFFNWYLCVIDGGWGTPLDMFRFWAKGESDVFAGGRLNFAAFWNRIYEACRYKYLIKLIK